MLALLRRLRATAGEIRGPEWLLLMLESLAVFGGIFIAFELQQWAERNREQAAAERLSERLLDEAEATVASLRDQRDGFAPAVASTRAELDAWLNDGRCPRADIGAVLFYPAIDVPTAVYEEMIGSGGLALLASPAARQAVGQFHSERGFYNRQLDYFRQTALDVSFFAALGFRASFDPSIEHDGYGASFDGSAKCDDPALRIQGQQAVRNFHVMQRNREALTAEAIAMCAILAEMAGQTCEPGKGGPLAGDDLAVAEAAVSAARSRR